MGKAVGTLSEDGQNLYQSDDAQMVRLLSNFSARPTVLCLLSREKYLERMCVSLSFRESLTFHYHRLSSFIAQC